MSFPVPQLDDLEFEQLVEQARAQIPRYAPGWTDHNLHDPGITLLELLAWIVDQQIYQVGLVSDKHLQAFAVLLGVKLKAAQPARGLIWPKKLPGTLNEHVVLAETNLSRGERVSTLQQPDLAFVLDANIHLSAAQPVHSQAHTFNTVKPIDLSSFFQQASASFEFYAGNDNTDNDKSNVLEMAFDRPLVSFGDYPVGLGIEVDPVPKAKANSQTPWGPLYIEYKLDNSPWQSVTVVKDGTFSLARTGVVLISIPPNKTTQQSFLRIRFDRGFYPVPLRIVRAEINVLPIVQFEHRRQQLIGRSNGLPDQIISIDLNGLPEQDTELNNKNRNSLLKNFNIQVIHNGKFESWKQSGDLSLNKPENRVFQLDKGQGQIVFGNGVNGAIPPLDAQILYADHHITKGALGNLSFGFEWRIANASIQGSVFGSNPDRLSGGEDAWNLEQLMEETRQRVLERKVMLSNQDLNNAVQSLDGFAVARSDVLLHYHPALPKMELPGIRTVVVSPWREQQAQTESKVSERYMQEVAKAIEPNRLLGERLTVITHQQVLIRIKATLLITPENDGDMIKLEAIKQLNSRFTDIAVAGSNLKPWPLGRPVTRGEIKGLLAAIPNVVAVPVCLLALGEAEFADQDINDLKRDEVAVVNELDISINVLDRR